VASPSSHSHQANSCPFLDPLHVAISGKESRFSLSIHHSPTDMLSLRVECEDRVSETDCGPLSNPFMIFFCNGRSVTYKFCTFFKTIKSGLVDTTSVTSLLNQLLPDSGYVTCPGISRYPSELSFKTKHLREWGDPFNRTDSGICELWHLANNNRQLP